MLPDPLLPLAAHERWYVWRWVPNGANKPGKPPLQAAAGMRYAANNNPDDWRSYKIAKQYVDSGLAHGVGIAITGSNICAFDMDDCFDADGELRPSARELVERCQSYTEWTPSGTGLRIIGTGDLAKSGRRGCKKSMLDGWQLEPYETGHQQFITITGLPFEGYCLPVADLGPIVAEYFAPRTAGAAPAGDDYKPDDNDVDWARFCSAVRAIPNNGTCEGVENYDRGLYRDIWVALGAVIYRTGHVDAGKLFLEFSKKSPRHRLYETRRVWNTIKKHPRPSGSMWTPATVYWIAQQNGWDDPNLGPPLEEVITHLSDEEIWVLFPAEFWVTP